MTDWTLALKIEHEVARIITQQEINGWKFDVEKAYQHVDWLDNKTSELYQKIVPQLGYVNNPSKRTCARPFDTKGDGYSKKVLKLLKGDSLEISGPFTYIAPILSENKWLGERLIELGWKPDSYTETGLPQVTIDGEPSPSLLKMGNSIGQDFSHWLTYEQRRGMIKNRTDDSKGWLNKIRPDGRIVAGAITCGTNTGRMRHNNVVNVPKAKPSVLFGREMRELFIVEDGYKLVGHDASGLEARMLAHYMNDPSLTEEIIHGDFHTKVWTPIKDFVATRDNAKNVEYALIYGAQNPKLGRMADSKPSSWSVERTGAEIRSRIMGSIPALGSLTERVQKASERGYLIALDGRKVFIRSKHSALNTLFQSAGAIVMKMSMIYLDKWVRQEGLDVRKVGDFHDEGQAEVAESDVDRYMELAVLSIVKAGEYFKLNCPLAAEAKVGNNWAETH